MFHSALSALFLALLITARAGLAQGGDDFRKVTQLLTCQSPAGAHAPHFELHFFDVQRPAYPFPDPDTRRVFLVTIAIDHGAPTSPFETARGPADFTASASTISFTSGSVVLTKKGSNAFNGVYRLAENGSTHPLECARP